MQTCLREPSRAAARLRRLRRARRARREETRRTRSPEPDFDPGADDHPRRAAGRHAGTPPAAGPSMTPAAVRLARTPQGDVDAVAERKGILVSRRRCTTGSGPRRSTAIPPRCCEQLRVTGRRADARAPPRGTALPQQGSDWRARALGARCRVTSAPRSASGGAASGGGGTPRRLVRPRMVAPAAARTLAPDGGSNRSLRSAVSSQRSRCGSGAEFAGGAESARAQKRGDELPGRCVERRKLPPTTYPPTRSSHWLDM